LQLPTPEIDIRPQTHNHAVPTETAAILADPFPVEQFVDYDTIVITVISDVEKFKRMKEEPYWKDKVIPDWKMFADTSRTKYIWGFPTRDFQ